VGGAILLWVDQLDLAPWHHRATGFSLPMYFGIGLACLAMIPGVSRSGVAIAAAMLLGADRRAALSFWVAMPAMTGALAYYLYNSYGQMSPNARCSSRSDLSFAAAWLVVKTFLD
jgi:undecaprenyl-diphosphatase